MKMEKVNHPSHYGGESNLYEAIKIIESYNLNFSLGNVIKYTLRAGKKENEIEDLEKAVWYLNRHLNNLKEKV
jgi:hypothetical protein|tara:strand:+ start:260 stop:478 length:219 start_codon:yes stop_codon:yes gene_type:complete